MMFFKDFNEGSKGTTELMEHELVQLMCIKMNI